MSLEENSSSSAAYVPIQTSESSNLRPDVHHLAALALHGHLPEEEAVKALVAAGVIHVAVPEQPEGMSAEDHVFRLLAMLGIAVGDTYPSAMRMTAVKALVSQIIPMFNQVRNEYRTAEDYASLEANDLKHIASWLDDLGFKREADIGDGQKMLLLTTFSYVKHVVGDLMTKLDQAGPKESTYSQIGFVSEHGLDQLAKGYQETVNLLPGAKRHVPVFVCGEHPNKTLAGAYNWSMPMTSENATSIINALLFDLARRFELLPDMKVDDVTGSAWYKLGTLVNSKLMAQKVTTEAPVLVPAYRPGTPLLEIINGGLSRDFENKQIKTEAQAQGFMIDDSLINYCRSTFNKDMDAYFAEQKTKNQEDYPIVSAIDSFVVQDENEIPERQFKNTGYPYSTVVTKNEEDNGPSRLPGL